MRTLLRLRSSPSRDNLKVSPRNASEATGTNDSQLEVVAASWQEWQAGKALNWLERTDSDSNTSLIAVVVFVVAPGSACNSSDSRLQSRCRWPLRCARLSLSVPTAQLVHTARNATAKPVAEQKLWLLPPRVQSLFGLATSDRCCKSAFV